MYRVLCISLLLLSGCQTADNSERVNVKETGRAPDAQQGQVHASTPGIQPSDITHKVSLEAPYYLTGPQQGRAPDGVLPIGTTVKLIEPMGAYALVVTDSGITAYVSVSDLERI